MVIVDTALQQRLHSGPPIRIGMIGAGFSGRNIACQILSSFPALRLAAISNRSIAAARAAYAAAGVDDTVLVATANELENAIQRNHFVVTDDPSVVCSAGNIDVIIETTGTVEFAAHTVLSAISHGKHVVLMNVELDATLGPLLKAKAKQAGVKYSNSDGDEPGVAMNLVRFVRTIGLVPKVAGNLKGLYDRYRNPDTQQAFALKHQQKATSMTSFADGTKLSLELNVLSNGTGFKVAHRGMYGPTLAHVNDSPGFFRDKVRDHGLVDFLVGAAPANGAFVLGHTEDPIKQNYLRYLKMGEGPLYSFYTPFHLPQLEIPLTIARAVLLDDDAISPLGPPVSDSIAIAKRDLSAGEVLDGIGGFTCYTLLEDYVTSCADRLLPIGVSAGCKLLRPVRKDRAITYEDVALPADRLCDQLRLEQSRFFKAG